MTKVLIIGFITGFLYTFTAFSSILTTLQFSLRYGVKTGIVGSFGCLTAQILWVSLAIVAISLGADVVVTAVNQYRFVAVLILLVVGLKLFFLPPRLAQAIAEKKFSRYFSAYSTVFSVAIAAPSRFAGYAALFILLGASFIVSADLQTKALLLLATLVGILTWWSIFAGVMYKLKIDPTTRQIRFLTKGFGGVFVAVGCFYWAGAFVVVSLSDHVGWIRVQPVIHQIKSYYSGFIGWITGCTLIHLTFRD